MALSKSVWCSLNMLLLVIIILNLSGSTSPCPESERQALLDFKRGIVLDQSGRLSSWVGEDCCRWNGVVCNRTTRHVVKLDLRNPFPFNDDRAVNIFGEMKDSIYTQSCLSVLQVNSSLLELKHLNYLDLSWNNFSSMPIPNFFGSFLELEYLNLSAAYFGGLVPHNLGNLSVLRSLDISSQYPFSIHPIPIVDTLRWTSNMFSLHSLDMSGLDLSNSVLDDSSPIIVSLPLLSELRFCGCSLGYTPLFHSHTNLSSLVLLDLSDNEFSGPVPNAIRNMTSLEVLDLSQNHFSSRGSVLSELKKLGNLETLNLRSNDFEGLVFEPLGNFTSLSFRDKLEILRLSDNMYNGSIPAYFGFLPKLQELHLNSNQLTGSVPTSLGSLSDLEVLDLSSNELSGTISKFMSKLSSLRVLDFSENNFSGEVPMLIGEFSNLEEIRLSTNQLNGEIPFSIGKLSNLMVLQIAKNQLRGQIPMSVTHLSNLGVLDLSSNYLEGEIPMSIGNLSNLIKLNLARNKLCCQIPISVGGLSNLQRLDLRSNRLNGTIPPTLGQLSKLTHLFLSNNFLNSIVSEVHFAKLSKLDLLDLSMNPLSLKPTFVDWAPPFQLTYILLGSCDVGTQFPKWLQTQTQWVFLNLSNSGISDSIQHCFDKIPYSMDTLDLSSNKIHGIPNFTMLNTSSGQIFLGSNRLEGPIINFPSALALDLSNNKISGRVPNIQTNNSQMYFFSLYNNSFSGTIPDSLCTLNSLIYLDLSGNHLFGEIPQCLSNLTLLEVLDFTSNNLIGTIPSSIGELSALRSLHLGNNRLHGEVPEALKQCKELSILDLGDNALSGKIFEWVGENMASLKILRLRSNKFHGVLPDTLCELDKLHILDVSHNIFSGIMPPCFGNFSAMVFNSSMRASDDSFYSYTEKLSQIIKGREQEYLKILSLLINLDLSDNNFTGHIPKEMTRLSGLIGLNLSRNHISGNIPKTINQMQSLESLDLSMNHLSGTIPQSVSSLSALNYLNLSYNDLSGSIPSGDQLRTLDDPSIYKGNNKLCGSPLEIKCPEAKDPPSPTDDNNKGRDTLNISSLYIGMILGFVVGFWGVCCVLLFNKTWRYAYFQLVDDIKDKLYVILVVRINRLKKKLRLI